ncbi:MAG: class I SAM-dependent methyltransferase [Betaproteobacteria bacterium]|nr:class I SAM-dependent methyltransferase [Betaproteobacteria bacterium]MDH5212559.1 class I SAM-dependent methyltransferase [Betaproteobacteria bacterium]MDH5579297.1 class I SAM-dependent methyltransferase [Betaproteobacteria bacterium]
MSQLGERLARAFAGRNVLELRGGDGQWTPEFAEHAAQVTTLELGDDDLSLPDLGRRHDALFAASWWSQLPPERLDAFLQQAVAAVAPGALMAFVDARGGSAPTPSELIRRASRCGWGANVELLPDHWLLTWWAPR